MFGLFNSPVNDIDRGREAMVYFHNEMMRFEVYRARRMSVEQLIDTVGGKSPESFLDGLGLAINSIEMRDAQVEDAMERLAMKAQGQLPSNQSVFFKALSDRMQDISAGDFVRAAPTIAKDTAVTAVKGIAQVGEAVIDTGKSLLAVGPILIVAAVIFIGYSYTRRVAQR